MFGVGPRLLAQPDNNTWDTTMTFSGSGSLPIPSLFNNPLIGDPTLSISLQGSGVYTADTDGSGGYYQNSYFQTSVQSITLPNILSPSVSPFSVTAPASGTDPGLYLSLPFDSQDNFSSGGAPFYGLYPPGDGWEYTGSIASTVEHDFQYGAIGLQVAFNGPVDLILGTDGTEAYSDGVYTDTYANSELILDATVNQLEPPIDFFGPVTITTFIAPAGAPDSSPGLAGILALLGVCVVGAWQKRAQAA
jgi:hypothetical protein